MPTAIDYDILVAVKAKIDALAGVPDAVIRKNMYVLDSDTLPIIVIGYPYGEKTTQLVFGAVTDTHQVGVAIVSAANRDFSSSISADLLTRDTLKDALRGVKLSGVPDVWDTDVDNGPPIRIPTGSGSAANHQVSTFRVSYKVNRSYTQT